MDKGTRWISLLAVSLAAACGGGSVLFGAMGAFTNSGDYPTDSEPFSDAQVDGLLETLDSLLATRKTPRDFARGTSARIRAFGRMLQRGHLSPDQTSRVVAHLERVGAADPGAAEVIDKHRYLVENLIPGRIAPNIVGKDTEGVQFQLNDYRGKIVALIFSGQWCPPCRAEYPYQRRMLERYKDEDMALLGVNSDDKLETIRKAKAEEGLDYRTWWDGHADPSTWGPIASAWDVVTWPAIFILDEKGVIRYVGKRGDAMIAAVDRLLAEKENPR